MKKKQIVSFLMACILSMGRAAPVCAQRTWQLSNGNQLLEEQDKTVIMASGLAGDLDEDGTITLRDAQLALKAALKIISLDPKGLQNADVNGDGSVTLEDASILLKAALHIAPIPKLQIQVNDSNNYDSVITTGESLALKGSVTGSENIREMQYTYTDPDGRVVTDRLFGRDWQTKEIPLSIGSNPVTITVTGTKSQISKVITIIRNSTQVEMSDDIIAFSPEQDMEDIKKISNTIDGFERVDSGSSEEYELIINQSSPLYTYIRNGDIQANEIIHIPANEYFMMGMTVRYIRMDDRCTTMPGYDAGTQEVIHVKLPAMSELLEGDACIASDELDKTNPFAFVYAPAGTEVMSEQASIRLADASAEGSFSFGNDNSIKGSGFQMQNLKQFKLHAGIDQQLKGSIGLSFDNIVLFDEDGKGSTK